MANKEIQESREPAETEEAPVFVELKEPLVFAV